MHAAPKGRVSISLSYEAAENVDDRFAPVDRVVSTRSQASFTIELNGRPIFEAKALDVVTYSADAARIFEAMNALYEAAPELLIAVADRDRTRAEIT